MADIRFGKEDVSVLQMERDCSYCGEQIKGIPFYISLDFRGAGIMEVEFDGALYCSAACAEEVADRIRATLPNCED